MTKPLSERLLEIVDVSKDPYLTCNAPKELLREAAARLKALEDAPVVDVGETEFGEAILWFDGPELIGETVKIVRIPK